MNRLTVLPPSLVSSATDLVLTVLPHGGQATARRNAWAGRSAGAARARARRDAATAVEQAQQRRDIRAAH